MKIGEGYLFQYSGQFLVYSTAQVFVEYRNGGVDEHSQSVSYDDMRQAFIELYVYEFTSPFSGLQTLSAAAGTIVSDITLSPGQLQ